MRLPGQISCNLDLEKESLFDSIATPYTADACRLKALYELLAFDSCWPNSLPVLLILLQLLLLPNVKHNSFTLFSCRANQACRQLVCGCFFVVFESTYAHMHYSILLYSTNREKVLR
mgnify:CR=1 FL=1